MRLAGRPTWAARFIFWVSLSGSEISPSMATIARSRPTPRSLPLGPIPVALGLPSPGGNLSPTGEDVVGKQVPAPPFNHNRLTPLGPDWIIADKTVGHPAVGYVLEP